MYTNPKLEIQRQTIAQCIWRDTPMMLTNFTLPFGWFCCCCFFFLCRHCDFLVITAVATIINGVVYSLFRWLVVQVLCHHGNTCMYARTRTHIARCVRFKCFEFRNNCLLLPIYTHADTGITATKTMTAAIQPKWKNPNYFYRSGDTYLASIWLLFSRTKT